MSGTLFETAFRELRRGASSRAAQSENCIIVVRWHAKRRTRRPKAAKTVANQRPRD